MTKNITIIVLLFFIILSYFSCASIPNGIMQDAKTLEQGEFEINFGGGLGSEAPAAIAEHEWGNYDWQEDMGKLGPLGLFGRIYEGFKFRAGLVNCLDLTQELWISFGYSNFEFVSKTRLKYSPVPDDKKFQIAIMPTFIGIIGPADVIDDDTSDSDFKVSFDAIGAELPLILSIHSGGVASPYFAINPTFLRLNFDQHEEHELPEIVYPLSLNFNIGLQIAKKMFALAPEFSYNFVFYKGDFIYNTIGFGIAGGVRLKMRNKN